MNIRIQCLSLLIILFTFNPTILSQCFLNAKKGGIELEKLLKGLLITYIFIVLTVFILMPTSLKPRLICGDLWYLLGIATIPIVFLGEISVVALCLKAKGIDIEGVKILSAWKKCDSKSIICTALIGAFEELVYRLIWFYILANVFNINTIIILIITSIVYALNHILMSKEIFLSKIWSGLIYGLIYYLSGYCIVVPIITHCIGNVLILIKGGRE